MRRLPPTEADDTSSAELDQVADQVSVALSPLIASGSVRVRRYESWVAGRHQHRHSVRQRRRPAFRAGHCRAAAPGRHAQTVSERDPR